MKGPIEIRNVVRFAVIADPHGAGFMVFRGLSAEPLPDVEPRTPSHVGWHELYANDIDSAFAFYSGLFGWTKAKVVEAPVGPYQLVATDGVPVGGIMAKLAQMLNAGWLFYFNVEAIDAAVVRIENCGGEMPLRPMQVPGGGGIVQARDPQGAMFALVACDC